MFFSDFIYWSIHYVGEFFNSIFDLALSYWPAVFALGLVFVSVFLVRFFRWVV